jgi:methanogenic corrinoid protein MtbC1
LTTSSPPAAYTIAAVSKLTGIGCHTLRVWERRHGFPRPGRSDSGHRRYSTEDVAALQIISRLVREGQAIGDVIRQFRTARPPLDEVAEPGGEPSLNARVDDWLQRLYEGDLATANALFREQAASLSPVEVVLRLIEPALIEIGEGWFRGQCQISQERCASGFLRRKLDQILDEAQSRNPQPSHTVLVGTVQGDRHEGGVLIVSALLELAGCRAIPLGVDLPTSEYLKAIELWRPDALAVSLVLSRNIRKRFQELSRIRSIPVFVGGRSLVNHSALAREFGLIPLMGSASATVEQLVGAIASSRRPHA